MQDEVQTNGSTFGRWFCRVIPVLAAATLLAGVPRAQAAEMALIPSHADGAFTVTDNEITIPAGGVRVFLDVYMSDWAPARLGAYEADMAQDGSAFSGGGGGSLGFARPACTDAPECAGLFGVPAAWANCWSGDSLCVPAYIDLDNPDWVFKLIPSVDGVGTSGRWAVGSVETTLVGVADPGVARYGGTFVIEVSPGAAGTFTVELFSEAEGGNTFMNDQIANHLPLTLLPALITIGSTGGCCTSGGTVCTDNSPTECNGIGGTFHDGVLCSTNPCDTGGGSGACCNLTACSPAASAGACSGTFLPGASCSTVGLCGSGSGTIGPAGGTIETPDGTATVDFPAGCVSGSTAMSIEFGNWPARIFDVLVTGGTWASTVASYSFEPSGLDFCDTAELCLTVDLARSGLTAADCASVEFQHREGRCASSPATECRSDGDCSGACNFTFTTMPLTSRDCSDPANATFCANIGNFSDYGLLVPEDAVAIPTVSEWGIVGLTLLLLAGAKVYFGRRRRAA